MLFANKASGITSMEDLLEKSKANPNSIKMGMSSGGNTHVYALLLQQAGFACNIVDGGDGSDRIAALVGGHVDVCFVPYLTAKEYVENGDVVPLCTIGDRCSALPDTPSINENGYVENNFNNYYVWLAQGHRCRHRFLSGFSVRGRCDQPRSTPQISRPATSTIRSS